MKSLIIKNEIFCFKVIWVIGTIAEFSEFLEKEGLDASEEHLHNGYSCVSDNTGYLFLGDVSDYVLLHECVHIVQRILFEKGIDTSFSNTEVLAYTTDWLYRKLLYQFYKYKKDDKYKEYED